MVDQVFDMHADELFEKIGASCISIVVVNLIFLGSTAHSSEVFLRCYS